MILFLNDTVSQHFRDSAPLQVDPIPNALAGNLILDVVNGKSGSRVASSILGVGELVAEDFPVLVARRLFDNDALLVVGDLVDNKLDFAAAQTELVEGVDAFIFNGDTGKALARHDLANCYLYVCVCVWKRAYPEANCKMAH